MRSAVGFRRLSLGVSLLGILSTGAPLDIHARRLPVKPWLQYRLIRSPESKIAWPIFLPG